MLTFGPVPSRRLGRSLGVNNIPAKTCTYSCVYCQLGNAIDGSIMERSGFFEPEMVLKAVENKIELVSSQNKVIDYITLVPDGEPTLDTHLRRTLTLLKQVGFPVAVITNSSLLWLDDVRIDLLDADFVSVKVDSVEEKLWRKINRPHKSLQLKTILEGIKDFSSEFKGKLVSETMLIGTVDYGEGFRKISEFLNSLNHLEKAYIAIPTRPPAVQWIRSPSEEVLNTAYRTFSDHLSVDDIELLIDYEGDSFSVTGKTEEDLLAITSVHPMRKSALIEFLRESDTEWDVVDTLIREKKLVKLKHEDEEFFMRKLPVKRN